MFGYSFSWYIFALTLLESIIKTHLTLHDSSHGFIGNSQRYFDDDLSVIHEEITSGLRSAALKMQLKFEPALLDFKYRHLGIPHLEKVTLYNVDNNRSIDMTSISGSTVHFHSSFFEDKKIPPMGNTTFNVVFLGREEGFVESSLFIHTTEGHFKYNVKGFSVFSPYRLRPIVGVKLPINASFSPIIYMHNPHTEPIQIMEVYSSGGDFHLELPSGDLEGPKDMWEIPPLQTKPVIRVRFQAKSEQNHTAYVRIKLNKSEEILVVPLEVEVSANGGIFNPNGSVDFGIGGSLDAPKQVDLCVYNPLKKSVRVQSVEISSKIVQAQWESVRLMPGLTDCVKIGTLTVDWLAAFNSQEFSGKITIRYKNGRAKTEIPYYLTVLEGGLSFDPSTTHYFTNDKSETLSARTFQIQNSYLAPVHILNYTLPEDAQQFFKIDNFKPISLNSQQEATIFTIKLKRGVALSDLKVNSYIAIHTNLSDVRVPLLSYNGKLQVHLPFRSKDYSLDLGLISFDSTKEVDLMLVNMNPVSMKLKNVKSAIPMTTALLLGCGKGDYLGALFQVSFKNLTRCTELKPNEYAIIHLTVHTSNNEGQSWGDVQIETQYENLSVPVQFKVAMGKLEIGPDRLVFDQCFPGKICSHPLRVHSTFNDPMIIEDIVSLPPDPRLSSRHNGHILARATKVIGHLFLDPSIGCVPECYSGLQHETTAQWLKTLSLAKSVSDFDLNLVNMFHNRYLNFTSNGLRKWQNLTIRLDTSEVRGHIFKTRVKMSWPSLLSRAESVISFPLTQIGNISHVDITLRNPSSYNLVVQLVLDRDYPDVALVSEGLPQHFVPAALPAEHKNSGFFFREDTEERALQFGAHLGVSPHPSSLPLHLQPRENYTFGVGFHSVDTFPSSALIIIRNNLTIVEVIRLQAKGAHPSFRFGNRKPGSSQPLSFELTEKHLKDCEREQFRQPQPNLTVKRSFTARNIGDVTVYINAFHINDLPCEGYGFKILNCSPFVLHPNGTKKIDIAFTPDLTLSKVTRILMLETSLSFPVNYTLHTTIPPYYLGLCSGVIARPSWESYLSFFTTILMMCLFVLIVLLAVLDADRIKNQAIGALMSPGNLRAQPVLDLRLVGQQTKAEIRSGKIDDKKVDDSNGKKDSAEKYTALVPTTGKSKKKLAKKNSDDVVEIAKKAPSPVEVVHTIAQTKKKGKESVASVVKKAPIVKKVTKTTQVPVYEEETSSTTTDCSSNNDEDKEKVKEKPKDELVEIKPPVVHAKVERKKSGPKPSLHPGKHTNAKEHETTTKPETTKRGNKSGANKKDRQHGSSKKTSADKALQKAEKRESPPAIAPSSLWGENRATFSDVVANSPVNLPTRHLSHTQTTKPTMYVEPYKQTSTELGPIGSRRLDMWQDDGLLSDIQQSNSYFSNSYDLPQQESTSNIGYLDDFVGNPNGGLLDPPAQRGTDYSDPWNRSGNQWNSGFSPLGAQPDFNCWSRAWESRVWPPWAEPPTARAPPGFDTFAQRKRDKSPSPQRNVYEPFGTANLWPQQQPQQHSDPWRNYQEQ